MENRKEKDERLLAQSGKEKIIKNRNGGMK